MKVWTYQEVRDKVLADNDLQNETFVLPDEMVGYCNDGIEWIEAQIHKISEDYYLTRTTLSMVSGAEDVSLPANCYAAKIRGLTYVNGSIIYPVTKIRGEHEFYDLELTNQYQSTIEYRFLIRNDSAALGFVIELVPPARESGAYLKCRYLRGASRVPTIASGSSAATLATKIDVPEFGVNFLITFMKCKCAAKENAGEVPQGMAAELTKQEEMVVSTLTEMVPNNDNTVVPDMNHYAEHE